MKFWNLMLSIIALAALGTACVREEQADLLVINGEIHTVDAQKAIVEAVAIKEGKILATGSTPEMMVYRGEATQVLDLEGRLMTPGLIEGHGHFMGMGYSLMSLDLLGTTSYEQVLDQVKEAVQQADPGEWIEGRGWHQEKWDSVSGGEVRGFPLHQPLSAVSPENPVVLRHASGHMLLANQKAMEIAGINTLTDDIEGGEIIRDGTGQPTGIFNETAMGLIDRHVPEPDENSDLKAFKLASNNCLKNGITSFHDAGQDGPAIDLFRKILDDDGFQTRLYVMLSGSDEDLLQQYFKTGPEIGLGDHFLTIRSVKLFIDGALGSRGAWLLEPYSDSEGHLGHAVSELSYIEEVCGQAIEKGFQVCTHAIGDRGNREVLNIYEKVYNEHPDISDPRFRIEHAQHLSSEDIPRFANLGVIPAMQAIHMASDRPWAIERLGEERIIEGAYVWRKLLNSGARIVNGTDVPVEPISPIQCFYASVTRRTLKGQPPGGYEPGQKMSREEALRSYTIDAAYGAFEEDIKGSIEPGKLADLTVFSRNIMVVPEEEILDAKVDLTILNGEILFERE